MLAAGRVWSMLLFFIISAALASCVPASNSALCSMSVKRSYLHNQLQVSRPFSRLFGRTFYRSTRNVSSCDDRHDVVRSQACRVGLHYGRDTLLQLRATGRAADRNLLNIIAYYGLLRYRGGRAGRCHWRYHDGETPKALGTVERSITVHVSRDRPTCKHQHQQRVPRRVLVNPRLEQRGSTTRIGLLNTQSIGNKYSLVSDCITSNRFDFFAAVETWHESADCPSVIACTPGGYHCAEQARRRPARDALNIKTNHGGVCLFYRTRYTVHRLKLPYYKSMEQLAVQSSRFVCEFCARRRL